LWGKERERSSRPFWICPSLMARGCRKSATMLAPHPTKRISTFRGNLSTKAGPGSF
jgi:hypothetical protein